MELFNPVDHENFMHDRDMETISNEEDEEQHSLFAL